MSAKIKTASDKVVLRDIVFTDKRLVVFILIIFAGLVFSANLLLSVDKTSKARDEFKVANQLLLATQELQIQYDVTQASITTFMFLGSNETWDVAVKQTNTLYSKAKKLIKLNSNYLDAQKEITEKITLQVVRYINALAPLKDVRQDHRGVVAGVAASNITQSSQHYRIISSLANAIEELSQDTSANESQIIQVHSVQNRWLRLITEFRALLLLRNDQAEQTTLVHAEQFKKEWNELIKDIDNFGIEIQPFLEIVDKNQKSWLDSLPLVINTHLGKRWRRDLHYMEEKLNPISDKMLSLLNDYNLGLAEHIKSTADRIINLEKRNLIWAFIVMGLIILFSLSLLLIYKRLLIAQRRKRLDAEHINKMKTEFLSTISHELRTPLNAILGFNQLLEMDIDEKLSEQQKMNINEISLAGTHLLHLVNEILDLSSIESGNININMEQLNLLNIIEESVSLSKTMSDKHKVHISVQATKNINYHVKADPIRLRQVLINLISNAIKYNKKNGDVLISIERKSAMTRINVSDTGCGISKDDINKLFQPFERLGKTTEIEGAGIGLLVSKKLIESMHGTMGVQSKLGKGSTFWIELVSI